MKDTVGVESRCLGSRRRYAVIGTGAVGGFYGAKLQKAGQEVHFLCRGDVEHVRQHGLKIDSCQGNFCLPTVQVYGNVAEMPACDVVIVALKATQNHLLPDLLPAVLAPGGVVLLLQNGLGGEEWVAEIVGSDHVMGGLCFISSNKVGPGHIAHLDYGAIQLGEYGANYVACGISPRMEQIRADLEQAGISIQLSEDLLQSRWIKLVWNIPFNSLSVILGATTDQMMGDPEARQLAEDLMREVVVGAAACGRIVSEELVADMLERTAKMAPYSTSMKLDYEHQRPLEVEAIVGNPLRAAQVQGADLIRIETVYRQLKMLDGHNRR